MHNNKKIFIMTGEASGDLHGGLLSGALKKLNKDLTLFGVGGKNMEAEGVDLLYEYSRFTSMGVIEPLYKIRFYFKALKNITEFILKKQIDSVILIDFPGFNLLLAKKIKKHKIKIIYYISPQIWAWHYSRIKKIKRYVDYMIVFYPFEEELYSREGVRAFFKGNPLVDIVKDTLASAEGIAVKVRRPCICLLPGSRQSELKRLLPAMLDAAVKLDDKYKPHFLVPAIKDKTADYVTKYIEQYDNLNIDVIYDNTYKAIEASDFVIAASGTVTLETAIIGKPMIVIYKVDLLSEIVARFVLRVDDIALVNIVAEKRICPELLQRDVNGTGIFKQVCRYLDNKDLVDEMKRNIDQVKNKLGKPGAVERIAVKVLELVIECPSGSCV